MERVIGIDFGTSTTYMSVKRYDGGKPDGDKFSYIPVMFNYGESSGFVASIMRENADGSFDFGEKASEPLEGSRIYTEVKMRLESPEEAERAEARRVTKEFFKFLYETYTQQADSLGESDDVIQTLVSYPVKWQTETAEFMLSAAREAGFPNVMGMDEATAAVSAVLCQNSSLFEGNKEGYLLLVDMGAGTTDLVVCKYQSHTDRVCVETVASWPQSADEPTVGGREIDAALEKYVEDYLTAALNPAMAPMARSLATAYGAAKQWKERNVSVNLAENKPVTTCGYISAYATMLSSKFPAFDRSGFEALIADGLRDYARLVRGCLAHAAALNADFAACGLSLVILTGGHSAWYFARDIVNGSMDGCLGEPALALVQRQRKQVINLPNPQTTVSLGLVYSKLTDGLAQANQPEETPRHEEQQDLPPVSPQDAEEPGEDSFASSQPAQQAPPIRKVEEEGPDAALAAAVKQFIAGYDPSFLKKIFSGNVSAIRQSFGIPYDIEVYLAHDEGLLIKTGKVGVALCSNGIYNSINTKLLPYSEGNRKLDFMSWREYVDAEVTKAPIRVTAGANSFCLNFDYRDAQPILGPTMNDVERFFHALQTYLRECCSLSPTAGSDEKAKAVDAPSPKQLPLKSADVLEEDETFDMQLEHYDPSKCPRCGTQIPANEKKCPLCGRKKLPELVTPYNIGNIEWFQKNTQFGNAKATGTLTIHDDRIEFRKTSGSTLESVIPGYNIYATIRANLEPREIFWIRDIAAVKKISHGFNRPAFMITMKSGATHTFAANKTQASQDLIAGAVTLLEMLIRR